MVSLNLQKIKYYTLATFIYVFTAGLIAHAEVPSQGHKSSNVNLAANLQKPFVPFKPSVVEINGMPIRLVIPDSSVDLSVIPGYYDAPSNSWTLSGYDAQFAMISTLPNNVSGQTFIYGHNNNYVFGALRHVTPRVGQVAYLYLSNSHILQYSFKSAQTIGPNDTYVLSYSGPPSLLIQTCTGSLNEWRTEYSYKFVKVLQ